MPRSPFEVLEISPDADLAMVDAAWRALARRFHPDANPGVDTTALTARMAEVNWARDELTSGLDTWRRKARRSTGGLNWGAPPSPGRSTPGASPIDLTPKPKPRQADGGLRWQPPQQAPRRQPPPPPPIDLGPKPKARPGNGSLRWEPAPDPGDTLPPLSIGRNEPKPARKPTLDWQARRTAPKDDDVWVPRRWQEWRAQQKAAEAAGEAVPERPSAWRPEAPAPSRRTESLPAVEVTPRTLHLPGIAGARASFVARVPGHAGVHIQCRFRDGLVEVERRGSSGDGVLFEVVVPRDITRGTVLAMQAGIDVLAAGAETTRLFVALEPVVREGAPRHAEDLLNPRISRLRWV